jgi:ABC-type Zn2+ transport system substrate-binding protein/surface adhesin
MKKTHSELCLCGMPDKKHTANYRVHGEVWFSGSDAQLVAMEVRVVLKHRYPDRRNLYISNPALYLESGVQARTTHCATSPAKAHPFDRASTTENGRRPVLPLAVFSSSRHFTICRR